jgi:hypothetical protein
MSANVTVLKSDGTNNDDFNSAQNDKKIKTVAIIVPIICVSVLVFIVTMVYLRRRKMMES